MIVLNILDHLLRLSFNVILHNQGHDLIPGPATGTAAGSKRVDLLAVHTRLRYSREVFFKLFKIHTTCYGTYQDKYLMGFNRTNRFMNFAEYFIVW